MKDFFIRLFTAQSGLSSKRVCGVLGWVACLIICLWCTFHGIQAPVVVDTLFICSTTLLGADTITSIWRKNVNKSNNNENNTN